jgi:cytosine/adenosine deaminase-related metal-dependent hydrolase
VIVRARSVVTMDGAPIEDGAVEVRDDRIAAVGRWSAVRASATSDDVLDLGEQVLLPGLINAHCHLEYSCLRGVIPRPESFAAWVQQMIAAKAKLSDREVQESIAIGLAEAQRFGTTSMADIHSFAVPLIEAPLRLWRFPELIDLGTREVELPQSDFLSPHALYTASPALYKRVNAHAALVTTHVAESREEMAMFRDAAGPLYNFLQRLGRPMDDCGSRTPVAHFLQRCQPTADYIVAHLNEIAESDWPLLNDAPRFSIAHCPRSHAYFAHKPFASAKLRALGFNIALGTDSLASNDHLNLFAEMRQLQRTDSKISPQQLLECVTTNAAAALRQSDALGRIRAGFFADLIALPFTGTLGTVMEAIVAHEGEVTWSMVNGSLRI